MAQSLHLLPPSSQCEIGTVRGAGAAIVVAGHLYKLWEVTIEKVAAAEEAWHAG